MKVPLARPLDAGVRAAKVAPMDIRSAVNLEDIRRLARRKLPRIAFDFIDGGVDDEHALRRNRDAFGQYRLVPRYLVDVSRRGQATVLLGRRYASPVGISPTGNSMQRRHRWRCCRRSAGPSATTWS